MRGLQLPKITPTGCIQRIGTKEKPPGKLWTMLNSESEMAHRAAQKCRVFFARRRETLGHKWTSEQLIRPIFFIPYSAFYYLNCSLFIIYYTAQEKLKRPLQNDVCV